MYRFLQDIRDKNEKKPDDPEYDPRTLLIPDPILLRMTGFERQFWMIKQQHYDTIVFFKKGKFYEMFEQDADIAHREFDLKVTDRVNMRMAGFPESAYENMASLFLSKGYKITRVEQTENRFDLKKRKSTINTKKKTDDVIRREVVQILTPGTIVDSSILGDSSASYLLSINEDWNINRIGFCFVDTAVGEFTIGTLDDDEQRNKLETLIYQIRPKELLQQTKNLSASTLRLFRKVGGQLSWIVTNQPEKESWDYSTVLEKLSHPPYFKSSGEWPEVLQHPESIKEGVSALGSVLAYLQGLHLDVELITMGNLKGYTEGSNRLVLDSNTLANLSVLEAEPGSSKSETLLALVDHTSTPFGKRLLKMWVCFPLRSLSEIEARLDAIDDINSQSDFFESVMAKLKKLSDLERQITRIHAGTTKLSEFLSVIEGFAILHDQTEALRQGEFSSILLQQVVCGIPDLLELLNKFQSSFDFATAREKDSIEPLPGSDSLYDQALRAVQILEDQLVDHKNKMMSALGIHERIEYYHHAKEAFQIEIPKKILARIKVPADFRVVSEVKDATRYHDSTIIRILPKLLEARENLSMARQSVLERHLKKFDENYSVWKRAVEKIAELDCLVSLANTSRLAAGPMVRPSLRQSDRPFPFLDIRRMWHPFVPENSMSTWIANDVRLGVTETGDEDSARVVLLTGPNMGGKSSLMRQVCIISLLAHIGCYVPAESCSLSLIDRIFTRIGANDNIMTGQSTFMVELQETSNILRHATKDSLVILDELGRGTSTFDGFNTFVFSHLTLHG
eukprot:TRINITY_DN1929_c0_g1_i2.p1 TRINITY_DN1929_c0_g1~~TRINITY_DN1929_c0_g1_i2.p1  ORF type:complete len:902 (+),score=157.60 TRINITY_DN1929_c0_g1_i2:326-2707(+)